MKRGIKRAIHPPRRISSFSRYTSRHELIPMRGLIPRASNVTDSCIRDGARYRPRYRIVSCSGIVCPLDVHRAARPCTTRHRGVMNAWNLSMDAAPMINRTCASYRPAALSIRARKGKKESG